MANPAFIIKATGGGRVTELNKLKAHLKYIGYRSKEVGDKKGHFDKTLERVDYKDFYKRVIENKALQHSNTVKAQKLMFALPKEDYAAYKRSGKDFRHIVRDTLNEYEEKHNVKLDWVASIHRSEVDNPHCHVVVKGVSDIKGDRGYKRIKFKKEDFKEMRESFKQNFEKDVRYKFHEKLEYERAVEEVEKGFNNLLIENKIEKIQDSIVNDLKDVVVMTRAINYYDFNISKISNDREFFMIKEFKELSKLIPGSKTKLDDLPKEVKGRVESVTNSIIQQKNYDNLLKDYIEKLDATNEFKESSYNKIIENSNKWVIESIAETKKKVYFQVDREKIELAVEKLKDLGKIDLTIEKQNTLDRIALFLNELNDPKINIEESLKKWIENNNIGLNQENINKSILFINNINKIKGSQLEVENFSKEDRSLRMLELFSQKRKIYLVANSLGAAGYKAEEIINYTDKYIDKNIGKFKNELNNLIEKKYLILENDTYKLTDKGTEEFLKSKKVDKIERTILNKYIKTEKITIEMLRKDKILNKQLKIKDYIENPPVFKLKKYDVIQVGKYFEKDGLRIEGDKRSVGEFTLEKLKNKIYSLQNDDSKSNKEFKMMERRIEKLIEHGYIVKGENDSLMLTNKFNNEKNEVLNKEFVLTKYDTSVVFKYIEKSNNKLSLENLKKYIYEEYKDEKEAKRQFIYIKKRITKNIEKGYLEKNEKNEITITDYGKKEEEKIKFPYKDQLIKKLKFLEEIKIIKNEGDSYSLNKENLEILKSNEKSQLNNTVTQLLNNNIGKFNMESYKENMNEYTKYVIENSNLKSYEETRKTLGVQSLKTKTATNVTKTLFLARKSKKEVNNIILEWNKKDLGFKKEEIEKIINKSETQIKNSIAWERPYVINKNDWKEMFNSLNKEEPEWMYKGNYEYKDKKYFGRGIEGIARALKREIIKRERENEFEKQKQLSREKFLRKQEEKDRER